MNPYTIRLAETEKSVVADHLDGIPLIPHGKYSPHAFSVTILRGKTEYRITAYYDPKSEQGRIAFYIGDD